MNDRYARHASGERRTETTTIAAVIPAPSAKRRHSPRNAYQPRPIPGVTLVSRGTLHQPGWRMPTMVAATIGIVTLPSSTASIGPAHQFPPVIRTSGITISAATYERG